MLGTRFAVFVTADIPNEAINAFLETSEGPSDGQALRLVDHEQFLALWPHVDNSSDRREDRLNVGWRSSYIGLGMDGCAAKLRTWAHKQPLLNPDCFLALDKNLTDNGMVRCCKVLERSEARGKSSAPVQSSSGVSAANMNPADIAAHFQGRLPRSSVYMPLPTALRPRMVDAQPVQEHLLSVALARQWPSVAKDRQLLDYMSHQPPGAFTEFPRAPAGYSPLTGDSNDMDIDDDDRTPTPTQTFPSVLGKRRPISSAAGRNPAKRTQISELLDGDVSM